jgi:hypothetical protein
MDLRSVVRRLQLLGLGFTTLSEWRTTVLPQTLLDDGLQTLADFKAPCLEITECAEGVARG